MTTAFGDTRSAAVVREISKTYEETVRGTLLDLERRFSRDGGARLNTNYRRCRCGEHGSTLRTTVRRLRCRFR